MHKGFEFKSPCTATKQETDSDLRRAVLVWFSQMKKLRCPEQSAKGHVVSDGRIVATGAGEHQKTPSLQLISPCL